jgi:pyruvate-formate lyase-activating enzyme
VQTTNRRWQNHLRSKGPIAFFLDRLRSHVFSTVTQFGKGAFDFPIDPNDPTSDAFVQAYFELIERFPYQVNIEFTNQCNLNCRMCFRQAMTRSKGFMSQELFRKVADEIAEKQPYAYLHLYGIGESTLHKDFIQMLNYLREKKLMNTVISTNAQTLLKDDYYKKIIDTGVSTINADLDGFRQETYGEVRRGGSFEKAKNAIEQMYSYVRSSPHLNTRIEVTFHVYQGYNEMDIDPFVAWCESNNYEYNLATMHTWAGTLEHIPQTLVDGLPDKHRGKRSNPCKNLWFGLVVGWDGIVPLCFEDGDAAEPMGDVTTHSIEDIWTGAAYRAKRLKHIQGVFDGLCHKCSNFTGIKTPSFGSPLYPRD